MLISTDAYGAIYQFSLGDDDMPDITNFVTQKLELFFEPTLKKYALNELGVVMAMVTSKPGMRRLTATVTGYIAQGVTPAQLSSTFNFEQRFYMITNISNPRIQGDYKILTLTAESHPGITNLAIG